MPKLLVVIVDGLHADALACAHVPCFDSLSRQGVLWSRLQAAQPNLTLPALASLVTSLPAEEHGVLSNSGAALLSAHGVSLFALLRYRHLSGAAFYSNDRLQLLFPPGSLQTGLLLNSQSIRNLDRELAEQAARHLQREQPDCCLLYLEGAKIAATHFGIGSEAYRESVEQVDHALGLVLEHLAQVGLHREYGLLVLGCGGRDGKLAAEPPPLPLLLAGPGIRKGLVLDDPVSLLDLAPTMTAILGLAPHPDWQGRILTEAFGRHPLGVRSLNRGKTVRPATTRPNGRTKATVQGTILTKV